MGQSASTNKQVSAHSPNFAPEVEIVKSIQDPHFGEVKLVKDKKTSQTMILKEIIVNTKEAFEQELVFYNNRASLKHPNVVTILGYTSEDKQNFCSSYFKVSVFIEVLEKNLLSELEHRKNEKRNFNEGELLLVADNLIAGLYYFQNQQHAHGDIRPFNIFVQENLYKLSDPSLAPQKGTNALSLAIIHGTETLLAPELLVQVPNHKFEISADRNKADVFSLGVTLLALATLTHSEDLYDYKAGKLNHELLEERLNLVRSNYSEFTFDLIRSMLVVEPNDRPDFTALSEILLPHAENIRNLRPIYFGHHAHHVEVHHADVHPVDVHHHHEEVVKRSAPVPSVHHDYTSTYQPATTTVPTDDLEARIRAAMERTQATFKAVATSEHQTSTVPIATTHDAHTISYSHYTPQVEQVHKSAAPVDVHYSHYTPQVEQVHRSAAPVDVHYSHYTPQVEQVHRSAAPVDVHYSHYTPQVEQVHRSAAPSVDVHHSYTSPVTTHDAYSHITTTTAPQSYTVQNPVVQDVTSSYVASEKERALRASLPVEQPTETVRAHQTFGTTDYGITSAQPTSHYTATSYTAPTTSYTYTATPAVDVEKILKSYQIDTTHQPAAHDYTSSYTSSYVPYTSSYTTSSYTAQPQTYTSTTTQPLSYTSHHHSSDIAGVAQPTSYTQDPLAQVYSPEIQKLINTYSLGAAHHTTDYTSPSHVTNVTATVVVDHHHVEPHVEPVVSHEEQHHHVENVVPVVEEHHHHEVAHVEPAVVPTHEEHHHHDVEQNQAQVEVIHESPAHVQGSADVHGLLHGEEVQSIHQSPVHVREEVHHEIQEIQDHANIEHSPVKEVHSTPGREVDEGDHHHHEEHHHHHHEEQAEPQHQVEAEAHSEH